MQLRTFATASLTISLAVALGLASSVGDAEARPQRVEICHVRGNGEAHTITVSERATSAHLGHGDTLGPCEEDGQVDPDGCSPDLLDRTLDVVIDDLRAALAAEDYEAVACNYHPEAFVIDDQGLLLGRDEIVTAAQNLNDLFNGADRVITQTDISEDVVRALFTLDGGFVVITDGTSTYVIESGMITRQTTHAIIEFTGPPPD